jgi:hypothetical protein
MPCWPTSTFAARSGSDAVASLTDVSLDLADELHVLEPFGLGNPGVTLLLPPSSSRA